jgi:hypothetical protein
MLFTISMRAERNSGMFLSRLPVCQILVFPDPASILLLGGDAIWKTAPRSAENLEEQFVKQT